MSGQQNTVNTCSSQTVASPEEARKCYLEKIIENIVRENIS